MKNREKEILFNFVIILNYIAQIPYNIHLYKGSFSIIGSILLVLTLVWFLTGYFLYKANKRIGFYLLLSFLVINFLFYFYNSVLLAFLGYGVIYHLFGVNDIILKVVFLIGDINFIFAGLYIYYLIKKK